MTESNLDDGRTPIAIEAGAPPLIPGPIDEKTPSDPVEESPWLSDTDPARPKNWSRGKKWAATLLISIFAFLQPLAETMLAPVERQMSDDLSITKPHEWIMVNTFFLIGVALSPLLLAPLSEVYGRKPILIVASSISAIWLAACGAAQALDQMLAFRALSGFGASVADALAGGVLSDLWAAEERGTAFAVFMAAPLLGPGLGPILGGFVSEGVGWRWIFWIMAIASGVCIFASIFLLHEMYEPRLIERRKKQARKRAGVPKPTKTAAEEWKTFSALMRHNLQRPFRMIATQVIVQILAVYMGILYGICFLFMYIYPRMWTEQYGQSVSIGSLNYISFSLGLIGGVFLAGALNDRIYLHLKRRNNNTGRPEFRIPTMLLGTTMIPIGLLWWGWSGDAKLHWIMPNIGSFLFAAGMYNCSACVAVYTIDTYTQFAASAISTNILLRSLASVFFPLFAPYMFDSLGFGRSSSILAGVFAIVGFGTVTGLWFFGERLRARSRYCAAEDDVD